MLRSWIALTSAASIALASSPARADDAPTSDDQPPIGMHYEERASRPLFWAGFGLATAGYVLPVLVVTGGAFTKAAMASSSSSSSDSSSFGRDGAPWLVPYAGPFLYLSTHPKDVAGPVVVFAAQVVGTGLLVSSAFVKQRKLVPGERPRTAFAIAPNFGREGGGFVAVGTF